KCGGRQEDLLAVLGRHEAEALRLVVPLHFSGGHDRFLCVVVGALSPVGGAPGLAEEATHDGSLHPWSSAPSRFRPPRQKPRIQGRDAGPWVAHAGPRRHDRTLAAPRCWAGMLG